MTHTLLLRHAAIAGAAIVFGLSPALASETPTTQDIVHSTASGSYLAARHAGTSVTRPPRLPTTSMYSKPIRATPNCSAAPFSRS